MHNKMVANVKTQEQKYYFGLLHTFPEVKVAYIANGLQKKVIAHLLVAAILQTTLGAFPEDKKMRKIFEGN